MWRALTTLCALAALCRACIVSGEFRVRNYSIGTKYPRSIPVDGGNELFRHAGSCTDFNTTIIVNAHHGYVMTYFTLHTTVDEGGSSELVLTSGGPGSTSLHFDLAARNSSFLQARWLAYGLAQADFDAVRGPAPANAADAEETVVEETTTDEGEP